MVRLKQDLKFRLQRALNAMQSCALCLVGSGEHEGFSLGPLSGRVRVSVQRGPVAVCRRDWKREVAEAGDGIDSFRVKTGLRIMGRAEACLQRV